MKWTKQRINNIFFFFGIAACVVMLLTFDVSFAELWQHICHAGYWLIPIVGIWLVVYAINALAWQSVIRGNTSTNEHVGFLRIFRLTITGYALNYATPIGGLGGEPYRIIELSRDMTKEHATSSVILYAMMHMFAHAWFWFASVFLYLILGIMGDLPLNTAITVVLVFVIAFCILAFWFFGRGYRQGLAMTLLRYAAKIPGLGNWSRRFTESHHDTLINVDKQIAALYQQDKKAFYCSLGYEFLSRMVQSLEILFMLLLFGIDCGGGIEGITLAYLHSVLILAFTSLFANVMGFLPMQLGVQEGGFVMSIAALGLSAALGIFVSIICRVREIIWIFIGIMLMKLK